MAQTTVHVGIQLGCRILQKPWEYYLPAQLPKWVLELAEKLIAQILRLRGSRGRNVTGVGIRNMFRMCRLEITWSSNLMQEWKVRRTWIAATKSERFFLSNVGYLHSYIKNPSPVSPVVVQSGRLSSVSVLKESRTYLGSPVAKGCPRSFAARVGLKLGLRKGKDSGCLKGNDESVVNRAP